MSEFGIGLDEPSGWEREGAQTTEIRRRECYDRESPGGEQREPSPEAAEGPWDGRSHDEDVGRSDLECEALQRRRGATTGQLPDPPDLPRVEDGVGGGGGAQVEQEHAWVTARREVFEHTGGEVERDGG